MEIYLIRHTRPNVPANTCYGQADIDVMPSFHQEVTSVRKRLGINGNISVLYSSPLKRCLMLSEALGYGSFNVDDRLRELDFGDWELKKWDDINQRNLSEWMDDFVNQRVPGGESCREMYERSISFLKQLHSQAEDGKEKKITIVTHGGVIRSMLAYVLGMPLENLFRISLDYGSISKIVTNESLMNVMFFNH